MKRWGNTLGSIGLLIAVLVLLNVLGSRYHMRLDLTEEGRYTLDASTREMLNELPEAVTVTAYFTKELPPNLNVAKEEFKDLLIEYDERSDGRVAFNFIDPNQADSLEQEALSFGIRPLLVNTRAKDKAEQLKVYMGAVVRMGPQEAVIPVIQPESSMEWELSSKIKQVSVVDKPTIGILQGHGEPSVNAMVQTVLGLSVLYNVEPMSIYDTLPIHGRFSTVLIVDPTDTIRPAQLDRLEEFMTLGHGVVIAHSGVNSDLQRSPFLEKRHTGMERWLQRHGVVLDPKVITDASCGQVQVVQKRGMFNVQTPVAFPYFPLITDFSEHPVTSGLEAVLFQFAGPVRYVGDSTYRADQLLFTSDKSNAQPFPIQIDLQKRWTDGDFPLGPQPLGIALEGPFGGGPGARMVVFGNGDMAVDRSGQGGQLNPDNVNMLVNAVDWVTDRTGLIQLRSKGVAYRPIKEVSDTERMALKWMNLLLPVLLVIGYGIARAQWRRRQRKARMSSGHVA